MSSTVWDRLVVEARSPGRPRKEEALLATQASALGLPVQEASTKQVLRRRVPVGKRDLCAGDWEFVRACMQLLGVALPDHTPYPPSLTPWLHRRVWKKESLHSALAGPFPVFVKPAQGWKRFTGFVAESPHPIQAYGHSRRQPVWCSDPVHFQSEWRAYVADGELLDLRFADHGGNRDVPPDLDVIRNAVRTLHLAGEAPAGYVIDFGVLSSGETALVEMNDGFAFGAYDGVSAEVLWRVTETRWRQLLDLNRG